MATIRRQTRTRGADEATDRERIAMAIGELVDRGYLTMTPWSVCCSNCGWAEIGKKIGVNWREEEFPEGTKAVWWHEQGDSSAFADDAGIIPQTQAFLEKLSEHDEEDEAWFEAHMEEAEADSIIARMTEYAMLINPLYIHWLGDKDEIAAALRAQGFRVQVPVDERRCIVVLPEHTTFSARADNGEVTLTLDGDDIQLTAADARKLVRKLNRAARLAEAEGLLLQSEDGLHS